MSLRSQLAAFIVFAALALLAAGCGGSSAGDTTGGATAAPTGTEASAEQTSTTSEASNAAKTTPDGGAKAAFIAEADAICEATDADQEKALEAFTKKHPQAERKKGGAARTLVEVGLPPVESEAKELSALTPPQNDDGAYEKIVSGIEGAVESVKSNAAAIAKGKANPFAAVEKEAAAYGFEACASPL